MGAQETATTILGIFIGVLRVLYWYAEAIFRQIVPPPMKSIDGEIILVTGATGGIGQEICRHLVKSGKNIKLVIWDLKQADLDKFAGELKSIGAAGLKVFPFAVDISTRENVEAGCQQIIDEVGDPTIIFNNAGVMFFANFLQLTNAEIEKTIDVNLLSHIWILRQFLPYMVANNRGRIANTCSMGALKPVTHANTYFASKFAVNGYTEALKAELLVDNYNYDGIKFTSVYPYIVQTPLIKSISVNPNSGTYLPVGLGNFLSPKHVGSKMVDGMRREYEYIYFPSYANIICFFENLVPLKVRKALDSKYMNSKNFVMKDPKEHEQIFNTPFVSASRGSSSKGKSKKSK